MHRCDGADFHLSKSHKKVLKQFNTFLQNGKDMNRRDSSSGLSNSSNSGSNHDSESGDGEKNVDTEVKQSEESNGSSASEEIKMITSNPKVQIDIENALKLIKADSKTHSNADLKNDVETAISTVSIQSNEDSPSKEIIEKSEADVESPVNESGKGIEAKPQQLKAKLLRQQRKAEKQMAKANSIAGPVSADLNWKKVQKNTEKTLKSLIDEMPSDGKYKLKVCVL